MQHLPNPTLTYYKKSGVMQFDEKVTQSGQMSTPRVVKRWLDTVFQGQYLPSLSINYVSINTNYEKLPPQLYQIKIKICYDQGCYDIGVVVATKSRYYLFYSKQYISALGTGPKSFTEAFSSNSRLDVREIKTESVRALRRYFGIKFLSLKIQ